MRTTIFVLLTAIAVSAAAQQPPLSPAAQKLAGQAVLPPAYVWSGKSRVLEAPAGDPWITPAEASGFHHTPSYDQTVSWLKKLAAAAPDLHLLSIGTSAEGRAIWMVVASREHRFTPEALKAGGKPTVLVQAGIHAGEIDGKDAGMMLLRDMTVGRKESALLAGANFLFIPILNVDGHERATPFGRINQRGPDETGWRTNAQNLNLNRDYTKLDTPETNAVVSAINRWNPDLYIDIHVTDGFDYQYDITYGFNNEEGHSPAISRWLAGPLSQSVNRDLSAMEHIPGPLVDAIDQLDTRKGIRNWTTDPRYSQGYGDARHLASILVENHSLKPYEQRVLGTYVFLKSVLSVLGRSGAELKAATASDRAARPASVPLTWVDAGGVQPKIHFRGVEGVLRPSAVSGAVKVEWTGEPFEEEVPWVQQTAGAKATRPRAYWIPVQWTDVIERLGRHGIQMEKITAERTLDVTMYRLGSIKYAAEPFEGREGVTVSATPEARRETFPAGSVRISTDQPLGDLAILLLEPLSTDSYLQWGFFNSILQRTEYFEAYVMEPMAERILGSDPELADQFNRKLMSDPAFRNDADARLWWLYEKTPFSDPRLRLYPVAREE